MPAATTPTNKAAVTGFATANGRPLSERDLHVLAASFSCATEPIMVDYEKLAKMCDLKDKKSAYKLLWDIKKKLGVDSGIAANGETKTPTSGKRGRKLVDSQALGLEDDDQAEVATPTRKKARPTTKSNKVAMGSESDLKVEAASGDEREEEGVEV